MTITTTKFDPVEVELLNNEISAIGEEMAMTISRTARSPLVRAGDFLATIFDVEGSVVGTGYAAPMQLSTFMSMFVHLIGKWEGRFKPGDLFVLNDPYQGWGHLPDVGVVRPIFWRGEHVGFAASYSHHNDIGGRYMGGSSSLPTTTYEEGLRLPIIKLDDGGVRNEALVEVIMGNVRDPEVWMADFDAKAAGCARGGVQLGEVLDRHGLEAFNDYRVYVNDASEAAARKVIGELPDGTYTVYGVLEDDGVPGAELSPVKLQINLHVVGDHLIADFEGTGPQAASAINLPYSGTQSSIAAGLKLLVGPEVRMNAGFRRPIEVRHAPGTVLDPTFPAAVGGRSVTAARMRNLGVRVFAEALPSKVMVPGDGADAMWFIIDGDRGQEVANDTLFGGWGGRPTKDGIDGVAPIEFGSYGVLPVEQVEKEYSLVVEEFQFLPDTGGAGRFRGALSTIRRWRFLKPAAVVLRTCALQPMSGFDGGGPPGESSNRIIRTDGTVEELQGRANLHLRIAENERLEHIMGGCPGHGPALERDPGMVLGDVINGKATAKGAREQYGVVISGGDTPQVDVAATTELRRSLRK